MNLIKWNRNPLMTDLFEDFLDTMPLGGYRNQGWCPAVNIKDNDSSYEIEFAVPGLKKEDFKISLENNLLTVSSEKEEKNEETNEKYTRKEFSYRSFSRSFTLPKAVETEKISAAYTDGLLTVTVPKKAEDNTKLIKEIEIS
jgi:HSP20 family protein